MLCALKCFAAALGVVLCVISMIWYFLLLVHFSMLEICSKYEVSANRQSKISH